MQITIIIIIINVEMIEPLNIFVELENSYTRYMNISFLSLLPVKYN